MLRSCRRNCRAQARCSSVTCSGGTYTQPYHIYASTNPEEVALCARAQSPEKLQARLRETAGALERERARLAGAERRSRELQMRLDAIGKARRPGPAALPSLLLMFRQPVVWHMCGGVSLHHAPHSRHAPADQHLSLLP